METEQLDFCAEEAGATTSILPGYLSDGAVVGQIWPIFLLALGVALFLSILAGMKYQPGSRWRLRWHTHRQVLLSALAFAGLGAVTGYMTALSREPAVHAVLPAVLSLVGIVAIYLVGTSHTRGDDEPLSTELEQRRRVVVAVSILGLASSLLVGALWGAHQRDISDQFTKTLPYRVYQAKVDARVKQCEAQLEMELEWTELRLLKSRVDQGYFRDKHIVEQSIRIHEPGIPHPAQP